MADVFISYAREDQAFAQDLAEALKDRGKEVWGDWKDIPLAADWRDEARTGIEASDSVVFVITRDSVDSENCLYELAHAEAHSKRIIPVRKDPLEAEDLPPSVAPLNWVDLSDGSDVIAGCARVVEAVDRDPVWVRGHTRWLQEALDWDRSGRDTSFLASGTELNEAEAWLTQAEAGEKQPSASPLHYEYILAGRRLSTQKQRGLFLAVSLALAVALALGANWLLERNEAREQRRVAISRLLANEAIAQMDRSLDTGLLLAVAAYDVEPTPEARNSVLIGLRRSERILGFLRGAGGPVSAVSFDPEGAGSVLASGSDDGRVRIWSVRRRRARPLGGHLAAIKAVVFSGDRRLLASVDLQGNTLVRPIATPEETVEPLPDAPVTALAFAPRSATLALGTATGSVALWHPERGTLFRRRLEGAPITALSFDASGTSLAAGSRRGLVVLRLRDGRPQGREVRFGRGSAVVDVAFGGAGRLASVRADGQVVAWTLSATGPTARLLDAPENSVSVAVGRAGDLVTGDADGSVTLWDPAWEAPEARLRGHGDDVSDLAFDAAGRTVASASQDGTIILWTLAGTPFHRGIPIGEPGETPLHPLFDLAFASGGGSVVASALDESGNGRVVVAPAAGGAMRDLGRGPGSRADLDVAPDGSRLAAAGQGGVVVWRLGDPPERERLRSGEARRPATAVAISRDAGELALGLRDGSIRLWRLPIREEPRRLRGPEKTVGALAFSPDRPLLAAGAESGAVTVWNVLDARSTALPDRLDDPVRAVSFSPDGRLLAYGGGGAVVVWDVASWAPYARLTPRVTAVTDVAFSPRDGRWLAVSDEAGRIVFWDVTERRTVGEPLDTAEGEIVALDFRPDGSGLAVGASSGAVLLWDDVVWSADEARLRICGLVDRRLADDERGEFLPQGTDVEPCA